MRKRRGKKRARHSAGQHHGGIFWCSGHWTGHGSVGSERPVRTLPAGINDERRTKKKSRRWGGSASPVAIGMSLAHEFDCAGRRRRHHQPISPGPDMGIGFEADGCASINGGILFGSCLSPGQDATGSRRSGRPIAGQVGPGAVSCVGSSVEGDGP